MRFYSLLLIAGSLLLASDVSRASEPATWPQWRGPTRDGVVSSSAEWPDDLKGLRQTWRVELGDGYSGPVVSADKVFTCETVKKSEIVRAFERSTGKQIWEASWEGGTSVPFFAARNGSWIRSTPAYDGQSLYVGGMRDLLVCLDAETGKERWRVDFIERFKSAVPTFGFVCSPLVLGDAVYVQAGASFVKLDKSTGKTIWQSLKDAGGMEGGAFSSPILAKLAGREQLLVQTRDQLASVAPETGDVLWSAKVAAFRGMNILTPAPFGDAVFTSSYGGKSVLIGLETQEKAVQAKITWSLPIQGYMSTPVVIGDTAYLHRRDTRISCIDLKTGVEKWTAKPGFGDYVSFVTDGKKILALDQDGELFLLRHNVEKYDEVDRKKLTEKETWAHLAVCGAELFVREQKAITAYRWEK